MFEHVDESRMKYICNKIVDNKAILLSNSNIWTAFLDEQLKDFVVQYNFNFFEVANRFHDFIAFPYKYDFSEDEIRRHWSFLHACRYLGTEIDDEYYDKLKARAKVEEKEACIKQKEDELDLEKEKKDMEKFKAERFNLIDMGDGKSKEKASKFEKDKIDYDNPVEHNLRNDDHFEKCIENIDLKRNENGEEVEVETTIPNGHKKLKNDTPQNSNQEIKINKNSNKNETENLVEKSINEINKATENKDSSNTNVEKLSGFEDDDVINALFKVTQKISTEEDLPKDLTIDGKDYKHPETKIEKEEDLFPISINNLPQHNLTEEEMLNYREDMLYELNNEGTYRGIDKTKSFDDLIKEDENLKTQYDNLNTYFKFAVKSLNYFVPKMSKKLVGNGKTVGGEVYSEEENKDTDINNAVSESQSNDINQDKIQNENELNERYNLNEREKQEYQSMFGFEENYIRKASEKINELIMSKVKNFDEKNEEHILEVNRLIDEEEKKMLNNFETEKEKREKDYTEPIDEDQERKKEKFKTYLFSQAQNVTTPELLAQIVNIIQGSYMDEIKIRNEIANAENSEDQNTDEQQDLYKLNKQIKQNDFALMTEKNKNSKEPEFIIDDNGVKKYKHLYRGMVQYLEKPPGKGQLNNEDSDDSYTSD